MSKVIAKLVRDKIPEVIRKDGREPIVRTISGEVLDVALNAKLIEEHKEFLAASDSKEKLEELADILEVVFGLTKKIGATKEDLFAVCDKKRAARGGFEQGVFFEGYKE